MGYYPVCVDMGGRRCLVIGGGPVAERKIGGLLGAGADITVVSLMVTTRVNDWAVIGRLHLIRRGYVTGDLVGHSLAFVATDDEAVNANVARDARAVGVLVNAADDPAHCDFILPAVLRRGALSVAVSTDGVSPALARALRDELDAYLAREDYGALVSIMAEARRALRARGMRAPWQRWRGAMDSELRGLVAAGRLTDARAHLLERLGG